MQEHELVESTIDDAASGRPRALWQQLRRPATVVVVLALVWYLWFPVYSLVSMFYLVWGEGRHLTMTTSGLLVSSGDVATGPFQDSVIVVQLGAQENAPYPIRVRVNYGGSAVPLRQDEIRSAIIAAIEQRRGATYRFEAVRPLEAAPAPGVEIAYDFWAAGSIRTDIILRCLQPQVWPDERLRPVDRINTSRSGLSRMAHLTEHIGGELTHAAKERCPGQRAFMEYGQDGGYLRVDPMASPSEVALLRVTPDTVRLTVGDSTPLSTAIQLNAYRADGSAILDFAPRYEIDSPVIVQLGKGGFRAVAPGIATVTVRPWIAGDDSTAARATFRIKVMPRGRPNDRPKDALKVTP